MTAEEFGRWADERGWRTWEEVRHALEERHDCAVHLEVAQLRERLDSAQRALEWP